MNIVIVEDSDLIRQQLLRLIGAQPRIHVVGQAAGEDEAVALIDAVRPDAVLLDLSLSPGSGLKVLKQIRGSASGARVLVLTSESGPAVQAACEKLGISGFYDKHTQTEACLDKLFSWLPPIADNEDQRLEALQSTGLMDSGSQAVFDGLTRLAADLTGKPSALISLIDYDRQWFLSRQGLDIKETSRSVALCAHAILGQGLMQVPDTALDPRFADNPLVQGAANLRFYAGMPLVLSTGEALGALCVIDSKPGHLSDQQRKSLKALAASVTSEIELRRRVAELEQEMQRRRTLEAHGLQMAMRDPLTALPNRATFHDRLEQHLRHAEQKGSQVGVLVMDLDRLRVVADTLGREVADDALVAVADRLMQLLAPTQTAARLRGEEFAVVLPQIENEEGLLSLAARVAECLRMPITVGQHVLHLGAHIGAALSPMHGRRAEHLLQHADVALMQARMLGGTHVVLYTDELNEQAHERLSMEAELRAGIARGELELYYQPKLVIASRRLCGMEALVRWRHPERGIVPPDQFIGLAEERGFISQIGAKVLHMALAQMRLWDAMGLHVPHVAVNVSPSEMHPQFAAQVEHALAQHGIAPERLELELTEATLAADSVDSAGLLAGLRQLGVRVAVDDFGVGYSSLGQLRRLPCDSLKIDRSFVHDIDSSPKDMAIVRAVVTMAETMGLRTVVEGVENDRQLNALSQLGCYSAQGYFISRPMPVLSATEWLRQDASSLPVAGLSLP